LSTSSVEPSHLKILLGLQHELVSMALVGFEAFASAASDVCYTGVDNTDRSVSTTFSR
jgi:hypothetical protein